MAVVAFHLLRVGDRVYYDLDEIERRASAREIGGILNELLQVRATVRSVGRTAGVAGDEIIGITIDECPGDEWAGAPTGSRFVERSRLAVAP